MNRMEPTQSEKDAAIENILVQGLARPKSLYDYLFEINRTFGLRYTFFNAAQAMITAILSIGLCSLMIPVGQERFAFSALFAFSPVLFVFIFLFTETIERVSGLYELKMTCKYTIQQLMAFRIVCLSLVGMLLCVAMSLFLGRADFIKALSISLSALFLFSFLSVFVLRRSAAKWIGLWAMAAWVAFAILPMRIAPRQWELFLAGLPMGITAATAIVGLLLLLNEVNILIKNKKRKVASYAGS